jgi:hypothetical protein
VFGVVSRRFDFGDEEGLERRVGEELGLDFQLFKLSNTFLGLIAIASQLMRIHYAIIAQSQRDHFTIATQSLHNRYAIIAQSLRNHCTIATQSLHNCCAIIAQLLRDYCTITAQSLRNLCTIAAQSFRNHRAKHCAIVC